MRGPDVYENIDVSDTKLKFKSHELKFKSHQRMQVEFISNNVDVMTHDCLSSVALALVVVEPNHS